MIESDRHIDLLIQSVCVDGRFRLEKPPGRLWERDFGVHKDISLAFCSTFHQFVKNIAAQYFFVGKEGTLQNKNAWKKQVLV